MKTIRLVKLMTVLSVIGFSLILTLTRCTKVKDVVVIQKYNISGTVTFPDVSGPSAAHGAVLSLYSGVDTSSGAMARTFADASGNYKFTGFLPGSYVIFAKFNTVNQNARQISDGFNFVSSPWLSVSVVSADLTAQNIALVNIASSGAIQIALDTINSNQTFRAVTVETHTKVNFNFPDNSDKGTSTSTTNTGINIAGGFNVVKVDKFAFDETNPANISMSAYVLLSTVNTFEPTRDAIGISGSGTNNLSSITQATGCTHGTMDDYIDSALFYSNPANSTDMPLAGTDTARFVVTPGSVSRYGDGWVAHGTLTAFYHHLATGPIAGMPDGNYNYKSDTTGFYAANGFVCPLTQDGMAVIPVDLYFIYSKKQVTLAAGGYNWYFMFEGQFIFKPLSQGYLVSNGHLGDNPLIVNINLNVIGTKNAPY